MNWGNQRILRAWLASCALLAAGPLHAQTTTGTAKVVTLKPTNIINTAPLDFGSIIPAAAGGTVSINAQTGALSSTVVTPAGGTPSRGQFIAAGTAGSTVTLSLAPSPSITITSGANSMTINQLRVSVDGGGPQPFGPNQTIGPLGVITFDIGGRLNVGANQAQGAYTGAFTLTMDYQ